jgi:hypothetical protein
MEVRRDNRARASEGFANAGVTGLKALGAREMTYRLCFLACSVESGSTKVSVALIQLAFVLNELVYREMKLNRTTDKKATVDRLNHLIRVPQRKRKRNSLLL